MTIPSSTPDRFCAVTGTLVAGVAVAAGAFGAHALRARLEPELLSVFETGARYQMYHGLALLGLAALAPWIGTSNTRRIAVLFLAGVLLFAGSLYALALTGIRGFGAVTPLGGVSFLVGWAWLARSAWTARPRP